jgi:hypothetical protein
MSVSETAILTLNACCVPKMRYDTAAQCLPGTCEDILQKIMDWINDISDTRRLLFLTGEAGTGKSAIAFTIAKWFDELHRLGSIFCFDRAHRNRDPMQLFSSIARDLADHIPEMKKALSAAITNNQSILSSVDIRLQFEKLLLQPTTKLVHTGPIIVIIDALDDSPYGDIFEWHTLLSVLFENAAKLPHNFRVLVTSRPNKDIIATVERHSKHIYPVLIDGIAQDSNIQDIERYVRHTLQNDQHTFGDFESVCRQLCHSSQGIFQWAVTACRFIQHSDRIGIPIKDYLDRLIAPSDPLHSQSPLDLLNTRILEIRLGDPVIMDRYKLFMGYVLATQEPLTTATIETLFPDVFPPGLIQTIVKPMGALLRFDSERPVELLDTSFRDFITDPSRSGRYHIESLTSVHSGFARSSIELLTNQLRFNICNLETPCKTNNEVPDLNKRLQQFVSPALAYSARYWVNHLAAGELDPSLLEQINKFLSNHVLFWIEALSLLGLHTVAASSLRTLEEIILQVSR